MTVSGVPPGTGAGAGTTAATTTTATTSTAAAAGGEAPGRIVHLSSFQSPTGNIGCAIAAGVARCDIARREWSLPPRPADCPQEVDFGQGLEVAEAGAARVVCAGDTARDPTSPKLPYGTASQVGGLRCVSRSTGMTCTSRPGHGFAISVQSYRLF